MAEAHPDKVKTLSPSLLERGEGSKEQSERNKGVQKVVSKNRKFCQGFAIRTFCELLTNAFVYSIPYICDVIQL